MTTQTLDPHPFAGIVRHIRSRVAMALEGRGLLPQFSSWRLAQDPASGLVVLFGVLNVALIAAHTRNLTSAYFQPSLLEDLTRDLQLQIVPSNTDGMRYAFILDRGQIDQDPASSRSWRFSGEQLLVLDAIARPVDI